MKTNYSVITKTNILNSEIQIEGTKEKIYYHKYKPEYILDMKDTEINLYAQSLLSLTHKKVLIRSINYLDIQEVDISICRRNYGTVAQIIVNEYHLDITIHLKDKTSYQIESQSWNNFIKMVDMLKCHHVIVIDRLDVYENYFKDGKKYIEELDKIFDMLADQYHLSHYRAGNRRFL